MSHQIFQLPKQTQIDSSVRVTPGAKAYFYATTTTTPQDTYTTSARNVAHPNPVVADANGVFPAIYLDPALVYKLTLTTSADVLIYTVDPVNDQVLSQAIIGGLLYPQTDAESSAGVTPVNYAYEPGDIRRYGAVGDGVTDDSGAINDAIAAAKVFGGCVLIPPPPTFYLCTQTLDATFSGGAAQRCFSFIGTGPACVDLPAIKFQHTGHGIDAAGARTIYFENIYFGTDTPYPDVGIFLSRNSTGGSVIPQFGQNVGFIGSFSIAAIYNYAAETGIYSGLTIIQQASDADSKCVIITGTNSRSLTSLVSIPSGAQSCIDHRFDGGFFHHSGGGATHDCFELETCDQFKIDKAFAASFGATDGRSIVFVNMVNNASNYCDFDAVTWEQSGGPIQQYGVLFSNHAKTPIGWNWRGGLHAAGVAAIGTLGTNPTLNQFSMVRMIEPNNRGLSHVGGVVSDSTWESQSLTFAVGTSRRNKLRGDFSQITWTTNDNSTFDDTSVTPTFVPNTAALAVVGAETKSGRVKYRGPHAIVSISLSAATSITAAGGEAIPVPKTPGFVSAAVKFINTSTGVQVAGGYISGAGIVCPAFATGAGETMLITAEYEPS
jgi:hypothetical protein